MEKIVAFLENNIAVNWIAPLSTVAIAAMAKHLYTKVKYTKNFRIRNNKKNIDIFANYCERNLINPIVSYSDSKAIKIKTEYVQGAIIVKADVNFTNLPLNLEKRDFVMILLKSMPVCDYSYYFKKKYELVFKACSPRGIKGIQLEIKNEVKNKIVDEYIALNKEFQDYRIKLNQYGEESTWKDIEEICFTIFPEKKYMEKSKGEFVIKDFVLVKRKKH